MRLIKEKYRALSGRDRRTLWVLLFFSCLALYVWVAGNMWLEYSEQRRALRGDRYDYEQLLGSINRPEFKPEISESRLNQLKQQQQQYEARLRELSERLLPLDESGPRENLKLELTRLAEKEKLTVTRFHTEGSELRRLPANLEGEALRQYLLDRPILMLNMTGHYFDLVAFLDDLRSLTWQVRIGDMAIESSSDSGDLAIQLELKL